MLLAGCQYRLGRKQHPKSRRARSAFQSQEGSQLVSALGVLRQLPNQQALVLIVRDSALRFHVTFSKELDEQRLRS